MLDPRMTKLAEVLVGYSTELKPGEKVLIEAIDVPTEFVCELVRVARAAGADPLVTLKSNRVMRALMLHSSETQMTLIADVEAARMREVQAYIGIRGSGNIAELSDVPPTAHKLYQNTVWRRVHQEIRVPKTRWVVLRWPHPAMAQQANRSTEAFEDFFFNVCTMDYARMAKAMRPLAARMEKCDRVRIVGPGTELSFSIKGIPAIPCDGKLNIPQGQRTLNPLRHRDFRSLATTLDSGMNLHSPVPQPDRLHFLQETTEDDTAPDCPCCPIIPFMRAGPDIPDGEVFTAPVRDSVNGTVQFNARTIYQGTVHDNVRLEFQQGKVIKAASSNTEHLNKVLDSDDGARHVGEFAIGFNPYVTEPMLDILFDEKIAGSFHFTPGQAYEEADNGNRSMIHWDLVCLQDEAHGGGEIYFDGQLIRRNGLFVVEELEPLNPLNLK